MITSARCFPQGPRRFGICFKASLLAFAITLSLVVTAQDNRFANALESASVTNFDKSNDGLGDSRPVNIGPSDSYLPPIFKRDLEFGDNAPSPFGGEGFGLPTLSPVGPNTLDNDGDVPQPVTSLEPSVLGGGHDSEPPTSSPMAAGVGLNSASVSPTTSPVGQFSIGGSTPPPTLAGDNFAVTTSSPTFAGDNFAVMTSSPTFAVNSGESTSSPTLASGDFLGATLPPSLLVEGPLSTAPVIEANAEVSLEPTLAGINAGTPAPNLDTPAPNLGTPAPNLDTPAPNSDTPAPNSGATPFPTHSPAAGEDGDQGVEESLPSAHPSAWINAYPSGGSSPYDYWGDGSPTVHPTPRPSHKYVPKTDDALADEDDHIGNFNDDENGDTSLGAAIGNYLDGVESAQEMEQDKNVQIVAGVLVAVFVVLWLVTAHQVMENPDGLCAGFCRLILKLICCLIRILCLPCRFLCCKGSDQTRNRRTHAPMRTPFPTDLELA